MTTNRSLRCALSTILALLLIGSTREAASEEAKPKVVCFGDSITKRGYPNILGQLLGVQAINAGVGGNNTPKALRRLSADVLVEEPDVVVVFFGTNDMRVDSERAYVPMDQYIENLTSIVEQCEEVGSLVVVCTLPPIDSDPYFKRHDREDFEAAGGLESLIQQYRKAAQQVAASHKAPVVDLNSLLEREPQWMNADGVHPTDEGNALIAKHVAQAVRPLLAGRSVTATPPVNQVDILVYGGSSSGVIAAIQSARMGKSVILLEPGSHLGGLTTGGLGATDIGNKDVIGGLSREFYRRVADHYLTDEAWVHETRAEFFKFRSKRTKLKELSVSNPTMWTFEPKVAQSLFQQMLDEAGVTPRMQEKLVKVTKDANRIVKIETDGGVYRAKMFIDATYEGDLMAKAGVSYRVGREANAEYDETLNGIRKETPKNQIIGSISPYAVPEDPSSGLIPLVASGDGGIPGEGDHRVQAYNFRLCFTDIASNRLPLDPPEGYDPGQYELAARCAEAIVAAGDEPQIKQFCNPVWMPNRKTDINNSEGISTDFIGENYDYPDANHETRAEIWQRHENYVKGFWYFMSTSPRVPESLRKQFLSFGPCRDEFQHKKGFSPQLYVREARRMVSDYVMTEHNCRRKTLVEDAVGMAAYGMDSHNCQRIVQNGVVRNEGDLQVHGLRPYPISYRSIVPKASECENLVVPVCVSATHIGYGSIRMEPVFMVLGQSAAISAAMAIDHQTSLQEIDYQDLRKLLWASGQVLKRPAKMPK